MHRWQGSLAGDLAAYRGHVYRMLHYCRALARADERDEELAVAAAFHDLGIWSAGTFDYLGPSAALARDFLRATGRARWEEGVSRMILLHHKLTPCRGAADALVEAFRRADLADLTWGALPGGVPRAVIREATARWPNAGFHRRLVEIGCSWLLRHPLRPLPMLRL
jgi:hypothetical protein